MPIRSAIWKVSLQPQPLVESSLANEKLLEDVIVLDMRILSSESELIGIGIIGDLSTYDSSRYRQSSSG
jgi:hypothetical protein